MRALSCFSTSEFVCVCLPTKTASFTCHFPSSTNPALSCFHVFMLSACTFKLSSVFHSYIYIPLIILLGCHFLLNTLPVLVYFVPPLLLFHLHHLCLSQWPAFLLNYRVCGEWLHCVVVRSGRQDYKFSSINLL